MVRRIQDQVQVKEFNSSETQRDENYSTNFFATAANWYIQGSTVSIDFLCVAPRHCQNGNVEVVDHNTILLDINHAKSFISTFRTWLDSLEAQFGPIEQPEFVKRFNEKIEGDIKQLHDHKINGGKIHYLG